jgi:glycosyltransferase involved in cell wall biosynthesis
LAFLVARATGTPILLRGESNLLRPRPWWIRLVKSVGLRILFSQVSAFLYIGTRNREYYEHYGVPDKKLFFTPYCVDNIYFQRKSKRFRPQRDELRKAFGIIDEYPVILFCGKLTPKKQPLMLLEAFAQVRQDLPCALLYVGDGILRSEIENRVVERDIPDVHITGFLNQSEIPKAYMTADILVLPSRWIDKDTETWGLTVNEGMNFSLPIIVTNQVGCAPDLVREDENGYVVPYDETRALTEALEVLISQSERRERYASNSLDIIQDWDFEACADGIREALWRVCSV